MTQKDKELLLKDLCTRSSYGLICSIYRIDDWNVGWRDEKLSGYFYDGTSYEFYFGKTPISIYNEISKIKPYLRPVSSMTEEERKEYKGFIIHREHVNAQGQEWDIDCFSFDTAPRLIDWLNTHHFDYRGLIKKGLAIEASEGMYNITK